MIRKQLSDLNNWFSKKKRKPLIIWGARQVGKSYLVEELFLKANFNDYVYIDLQRDKDANNYFKTTNNPKDYLMYIESRFNKKISNECPLAFDEVQTCISVLTTLKYFNQDYPELPVIATGSMVRLVLDEKKEDYLFPVGKVETISLHPLTFEEYLMNSNRVVMDKIVEAYNNKKPLNSYDHEIALDLLHEYLSIGGMPEVVDNFLENKSYVDSTNLKKELFENYLSDMSSYNISYETILKTRNVYKNIFSELNKENKNFKISLIEKGKSNRDYFNAYKWLELASVVNRSRKKEGKVTLPLIEDEDGLFRMYLSDPGMFSLESNISNADFYVKDKRNTLLGIFYENYVACEFVARNIPLYYWCGKSNHEFEFIVENNGKVIPIDVKKSSGKLNSLTDFRNHNPLGLAIKISSNNYGYDSKNQLLTIPLYEVFLLADDIRGNSSLV